MNALTSLSTSEMEALDYAFYALYAQVAPCTKPLNAITITGSIWTPACFSLTNT